MQITSAKLRVYAVQVFVKLKNKFAKACDRTAARLRVTNGPTSLRSIFGIITGKPNNHLCRERFGSRTGAATRGQHCSELNPSLSALLCSGVTMCRGGRHLGYVPSHGC